MILRFLLNIEMIWMIYLKILKNTIQIKKLKMLIVFDEAIADMLSNKKLSPILTELCIREKN